MFVFIYLQELEKSLKATCEEFIMAVTKQVVDPMLSFVTKVHLFSPLSVFSQLKILESEKKNCLQVK